MPDTSKIIAAVRRSAIQRKTITRPDAPIGIVAGAWSYDRKAGVKQAATGPIEVVAFANTAAVDLESEVVVPTGLDVASYLTKNRNLFADHNYDVCSAVAVMRSMSLVPAGWICRGVFHDDMANPYVRACVALARSGTLGMSIGFEALDWGAPTADERAAYPGAESIVRKARVLEVSYTAFPMNVTCRQIGTGIVAAEQNAEKARKSLMEANVPTDIMGRLGVRRRALIVRASPLRDA
jgi:hypothetical protein